LALKLSKTKPREGRFARIFFAIVLYVFFMQSMLTMKDWIKLGQWPPEIGLWPIPIVFLMIALWSPKRRLKPGVVK
jgi:lipopolysaccharide export system permease protein